MGSPTSFAYLKQLEPQLRIVASKRSFRLLVICRRPGRLEIEAAEVTYHSYGTDYADLIASFDIGLAPFMSSDLSATGKVGMKHQEFLLCGIPQVCSAVGISEDARDEEHVLIASRVEDWAPAILRLMEDEGLRRRLAQNGRTLFSRLYAVESLWPAVKRALTVFP
jgi:glycosyltransferase involved in cell wall biosynthesis